MATYPQGSFHFTDHTADVGIRVTSATLGGLFELAALALTELITSVDAVMQTVERQIRLQEDDLEVLLVSWLQELVYLLDTEGLIFGRFKVNLKDSGLEATAWGESFNREVHSAKTEIKAVTYHQIEVIETDRGWEAQVVVDL